jgi:hypothetical protein
MNHVVTEKGSLPRTQDAPQKVITLRRTGQYLSLTPVVRWLEQYLYAVRHMPINDNEHGLRVVKYPYPLVWMQEWLGGTRTWSQCLAGLEPLVRELLEDKGYLVALAGKRPAELPSPKLDNLADLEAIDAPVLEWVQRCERGLIGFNPEYVRPAALIAQAALAWPKLKVVVMATSECISLGSGFRAGRTCSVQSRRVKLLSPTANAQADEVCGSIAIGPFRP